MLLSKKTYVALLWGIFLVIATSATANQTTSINSTAVHNVTETTVRPTKETEEAIVTSRSDGAFDLVAVNTVAATIKSTEPPLHHTTTAVKTTAGIAPPSHISTISKAAEDAKHQQPPTAMTVAATATVATSTTRHEVASNVTPTTSPAKSSQVPVFIQTLSGPSASAPPSKKALSTSQSNTRHQVTSKLSPTTSPKSSQAPLFIQTPSGPSAATSPSRTTLSTSEAAPVVGPTSTTSTELLSTPQSTNRHEVASNLSPTSSPAKSSQAPVFIQTLSGPSASATPSKTTLSTSEAAPVVGPTSTKITELLSTSQSTTRHQVTSKLAPTTSPPKSSQAPVFIQTLSSPSAATSPSRTTLSTSEAPPVFDHTSTTSSSMSTSHFPDRTATSESSEMSKSTDSPISTTNISTHIGIFRPHTPTRLPVPTTKSTVATTAPQSCSTRGLVKQCLIAIASLAVLATVFMVLTIVLCTKLSARKYKLKKPQPATEMMCISSLLPERNHGYSRQRNPVTNGVLVIHGGADSDEDGEDNLTLSSFLPENDRFV